MLGLKGSSASPVKTPEKKFDSFGSDSNGCDSFGSDNKIFDKMFFDKMALTILAFGSDSFVFDSLVPQPFLGEKIAASMSMRPNQGQRVENQ